MHYKNIYFSLTLFISLVSIQGQVVNRSDSNFYILYDSVYPGPDKELLRLQEFLNNAYPGRALILPLQKMTKNPAILKEANLLWIYKNDTIPPGKIYSAESISVLKKYIKSGGNILLANQAVLLLHLLGLEDNPPATRLKASIDDGYGRQLGYHAFRSHPLFSGMNGGAYVLKPLKDTSVLQSGYFGNDAKFIGKIIAVDWDYIFLRENSRMILEYSFGKGRVLAIGGYLLFDLPNRNRQHLEKFVLNAIGYLTDEKFPDPDLYWVNGRQEVIRKSFNVPRNISSCESPEIEINDPLLFIGPKKGSGNYWDLAGERMLVMGTDSAGITEIWAHPFLALRDYKMHFRQERAGIKTNNAGGSTAEILVSESSYERKYDLDDGALTESICVSPFNPVAVVNYDYSAVASLELDIDFTLLFRLMWPYSEKVLGEMYYSWNKNLQAFIASDRSGEFVSIVGVKVSRDVISNNTTRLHISHYKGINTNKNVPGMSSQGFSLKLASHGPCNFHVIISASSEGFEKTLAEYLMAFCDPASVFHSAAAHADSVLKYSLTVTSPDSTYNSGFRWALIATDRFQVNTPGIGSSLTAGYATSDNGWDGQHRVSGRPGYGWYFGRDGEWSGFALLHYGDFDRTRQMLATFQRFQDLNGKIFHELSTSGIAHYDAADATPLYIILAGRYLRHSGDSSFIRQSWPNIIKAIDFCYSTDTDSDGMIENTNVGHGWVEGGHLFGSHTSLYLASCWAEALDEAANIATLLGKNDLADRFINDASRVKTIINRDFWNAGYEYFYHGLMPDGSYMENISIMPAIPMLFGQIDPEKTQKVLPVIATNAFTSDWGCRIVPENDQHFNPRGYHTGSVWPLFTGWAALAEFRNGNYLQGYAHLYSNLQIWKFWGLGFNEEVLNGEVFLPAGVCHHQCWSETMALQPVIEGMLGYRPDALNHRITLKPWFPADWDSVKVENIRLGQDRISMSVWKQVDTGAGSTESAGALNAVAHPDGYGDARNQVYVSTYVLRKASLIRLDVRFQPVLPPGSKVEKITVNGQPARDWGVRTAVQGWVVPEFGFWFDSLAVVRITWKGGVSVLPITSDPQPGEWSKGFRILNTACTGNMYSITLQAPRTSRQKFRIWTSQPDRCQVEGAGIIAKEGNILILQADFADVEKDYATKEVRVTW